MIARLVCRLVLDVLEAQPAISSVKRDLLPYLVRTQVCAHRVWPVSVFSFAEPPTPLSGWTREEPGGTSPLHAADRLLPGRQSELDGGSGSC